MKKSIILRNVFIIDYNTKIEDMKLTNLAIVEGLIKPFEENYQYDIKMDLNGSFVLPGLINTHVHAGFKYLKGKPLRNFQEEYLKACINEGVTTIRDEGMLSEGTIDEVIEKKKVFDSPLYPRIITTGKFFAAAKGYGGLEPIEINSVEEAKLKVNEVINKGIDMIKTSLEDGLDPSTFGLPKLSDEILKTICMQAHLRGVKVSAHVTQAHNLVRLIDAGIADASHMIYDHLTDEIISKMVEKNIYIVPTLTVLKMVNDKYNVPVLDSGMRNVLNFVQKGGKIGLGDDFIEEKNPWYRLGIPKMEIELLKAAGLTNLQIITAATMHGAEICSLEKEIGSIEFGKQADLLIVKDNPLENINNLYNVNIVIKEGIIIRNNLTSKY